MIVINYTTSYKALDSYINSFNETKENLSEKIRQGASATARDIIRIYGISLIKANGVENLDINNLPSLRTNNIQLSKMANASPRTIQRHVKRLQEAGVITKKIWHGTNSSYELWISPKILLAKQKRTLFEEKKTLDAALQKSLENDQKAEFLENSTPNCPHTESCNNSYINNIVIGVHNPEIPPVTERTGDDSGYHSGNEKKRRSLALTEQMTRNLTGNRSGHTGGKVQKKSVSQADWQDETGGKVRSLRADQKTGEDQARAASLNLYVTMLWTLAKNVLYKDVFLTDRQEKIGKQLLYHWYEPVKAHNLSRIHQIYVERIAITRKFVQKDPINRFVQLPDRFFDINNPSGFTGTKKWWEEQEKRKEEIRAKLILHAQIRRFINNEKKESHKRKPPLQLYRECETRVSKLRDPALLEQFHAAILNPPINNHLYQ